MLFERPLPLIAFLTFFFTAFLAFLLAALLVFSFFLSFLACFLAFFLVFLAAAAAFFAFFAASFAHFSLLLRPEICFASCSLASILIARFAAFFCAMAMLSAFDFFLDA